MIYSVIIGDQSAIKNDWSVETDQYKNIFFRNDDIRQKIRIGSKVKKEEITLVASSSNFKAYETPKNTFFSNNYKNMNLYLLNFYSKNNEENHEDEDLVYLTIDKDSYTIYDYNVYGNSIIQTYRKKDSYQGCAILIKNMETTKVITLTVKDHKTNRFTEISVFLDELETGPSSIRVEKNQISDNNEIMSLKKIIRRNPKFNRYFKIELPIGKLATSTYITTDDKKEFVRSLVDDIPDANIIIVDESDLQHYDNLLKEELVNKRIRAVTTVGVDLPLTFCKDYNILYLFSYDEKFNFIRCLKSN